jgi:DNA adenine methylase
MSFSGLAERWSLFSYKKKCWQSLPRALAIVARRLTGVRILHGSAFEVIPMYDSPETWMYIDPPYYHPTRVGTNWYDYEMSGLDHLRLLRLIKTLAGKVILSGYPHRMYDNELAGWDRVEIDVSLSCGITRGVGTRNRRTEVLWLKS